MGKSNMTRHLPFLRRSPVALLLVVLATLLAASGVFAPSHSAKEEQIGDGKLTTVLPPDGILALNSPKFLSRKAGGPGFLICFSSWRHHTMRGCHVCNSSGTYEMGVPLRSKPGPPAERRSASENTRRRRTKKLKPRDELRREYDLSKLKGVARGKYAARYRAGTNLVLLSPDVAEYFPDEQSVNTALRTLIHVAKWPLRLRKGRA